MSKKIYTGAHLLAYKENDRQFGSVDALYDIVKKNEKARISLRKEDLKNLVDDEQFLTFELSFKQLKILADVSKSVVEKIDFLITLDKRDKLKKTAYLD